MWPSSILPMPYEKIQLVRFSHHFTSTNCLFDIKTIKDLDLCDNSIGANQIIHLVDILRENTVRIITLVMIIAYFFFVCS